MESSGFISANLTLLDVLPLIHLGLESSTHALVDASMRCLPIMLPVLDFSTVKDEVFPPIASVFSKTSSLLIKVRGLEAFVILCGGSNEQATSSDDDLSGIINEPPSKSATFSSILDKYSVQEKLLPLLKAIKTKEPTVMMAALKVIRQVGQVADIEFVALEVLPILWNFSLGPLLNVQQFTSFMELIKSLSSKVEREQTKKLQELASTDASVRGRDADSNSFGGASSKLEDRSLDQNGTSDFERLVLGRDRSADPIGPGEGWDAPPTNAPKKAADRSSVPTFSWASSNTQTSHLNSGSNLSPSAGKTGGSNSRSVTPDMNMAAFPALEPTSKQQNSPGASFPSAQAANTSSWSSSGLGVSQNIQHGKHPSLPTTNLDPSKSMMSQLQASTASSSFSIPPPPSSKPNTTLSQPGSASVAPSLSRPGVQQGQANPNQQQQQQQKRQGLDKYESLI